MMSAYSKEIKKLIVGIKAHDASKVYELDSLLNDIAVNGSVEDIQESIFEVEKFLYQELLNFDVVGKAKTA